MEKYLGNSEDSPARGIRGRLLLVAATLLVSSSVPGWTAETFTGVVVGVSDGDTISVIHEGQAVTVRLEGIDCPERGQPHWQRAKEFTRDLVFHEDVVVEIRDGDRFGRVLGRVSVDDQDVSLALVTAGLAWHYREYSRDKALASAELSARTAKQGLWREPDPTPPWDYRREQAGR